jgi:hypothetical protein
LAFDTRGRRSVRSGRDHLTATAPRRSATASPHRHRVRADGSTGRALADPTYSPINEPLIVALPGTAMLDPDRWQPLALSHQVSQNGIPIPGNVQVFVAPQWARVLSFAADFDALLPGPPPRLHDPDTDAAFKQAAVDVIRASSELTPDDGVEIDISPASLGDNPLGTNDGGGYPRNPVTGQPYAPEIVRRGDFRRVIAEFWADGPNSETPPGHWNVLANHVADSPFTVKRIGGSGPVVDDLEWDVKAYFAVNAAVHDAAVGCWGTKRVYDSARPISMIRYMGERGQSSDPDGPSYDPDGLPLIPGLIEVITADSSAPGERHHALAEFVGEVALNAWPGAPADPATQHSGRAWSRARTWVPYQKDTFVTPAFSAYTSGHSTFSRAAAEVLARFTGSPYFPRRIGNRSATGAALPEVRAGADDRYRAAVGDLLRRRRPGGPVAHLGRHPHSRRRLHRPPHGLDDRGERVRQGADLLGAGCQRHRRAEPDADAGGEHDRRRGDADVYDDRWYCVADAVAAAAGRLRPAESARCAALDQRHVGERRVRRRRRRQRRHRRADAPLRRRALAAIASRRRQHPVVDQRHADRWRLLPGR